VIPRKCARAVAQRRQAPFREPRVPKSCESRSKNDDQLLGQRSYRHTDEFDRTAELVSVFGKTWRPRHGLTRQQSLNAVSYFLTKAIGRQLLTSRCYALHLVVMRGHSLYIHYHPTRCHRYSQRLRRQAVSRLSGNPPPQASSKPGATLCVLLRFPLKIS
jgi:hypothetical protein